jgi:hypothetical protein
VTRADGETVTTTVATAHGRDALAMVRSARPRAGVFSETETSSEDACTASASYVQRKTDHANNLVNSRFFTVSGGGQPVRHSEMSGGLLPVRHVLPITECVIQETVNVEFVGAPRALFAWQIPPALPLPEDNLPTISMPVRVAVGGSRDSDRWRMTVSRTYRTAGREASLADLLNDQVVEPNRVGTDAGAETRRGAAGGPGGSAGGTLAVGNIGGFPGLTFGGIAGRRRGFSGFPR